ncbi:hypothetical protein ACIBQX_42860 [Nonomuraea sp. NPDC049714]|uniref:hypothetical protein n=1 Tax=Nonomuraea sp. NPDC049714 TaxID=3364357 RepID=UPI0037B4A0D9
MSTVSSARKAPSVLAPARATLIGCAVLTGVSALAGMAPLVAVVEISRRLLRAGLGLCFVSAMGSCVSAMICACR